jgi:hypothetical protein
VTGVNALGLISNPLMNGTTNWTSRGTSGTGVVTVTADAPELGDLLNYGNWLTVRNNNTAGASSSTTTRGFTLDATKYSAGDVLAIFAIMDTTVASSKLQITNNDVGFAVALDTTGSVLNPGPVMGTFTVPASPGTLRAAISVTAAVGQDVTGRLGAIDVFNLTTGGLTDVA